MEKSKYLIKGVVLNNERYEIVEEIGVGGFGNVYFALDNKNSKKRYKSLIKLSLFNF